MRPDSRVLNRHRNADAKQLAGIVRCSLPLSPLLVLSFLQRCTQQSGVIAAIKLHICTVAAAQAGAIRKLFGLDEVFETNIRCIHVELSGGLVEQAVYDQRRLRASRAAIGCERCGVGIKHIDIAVIMRHFVRPGYERGGQDGNDDTPRQVRACRCHETINDGQNLTGARQPHLRVVLLLAFMDSSLHVFEAIFDPAYGPINLPRRPGDQKILDVERFFCAKAAANVGRGDADALFRHIEDVGVDAADHMRRLRRGVDSQAELPQFVRPRRQQATALDRDATDAPDIHLY